MTPVSSNPPSAGEQSPASASAPAVGRLQRILAYRRFWWLALGIFTLDQISKIWIDRHLPLGSYGPYEGITIVDGFFYLVHVGNTGAAWSLFAGQSAFLAILAAVTLGAIFGWRRQLGLNQPLVQLGFGLLCGGIVGNLVDRLIHGHVIDFLDFHFGSYTYPTFNVADSGICIGVGIYLIHSLRHPDGAEAGKK